ncbi:MAG: nucleotidyl transferase AbiEii/AbiGii toxin family protein [Kiritimatiellae bacterium]|nr:nucleotidyl transferase AbiEii/AbiGii toxin family protein [Kiritimatiellia bacterium]
MSLRSLFRGAVAELRERKITFAVAGGFAAGLYRSEPRVTMDVDLVVLTGAGGHRAAVSVIEALGLHAGTARKADLAGGPLFAIRRRSTEPSIIVGRPAGRPSGEGVDILLPAIPWVPDAVERAQDNKVDFGFGRVPVLTLEDTIISKLYVLGSAHLRVKHLDDLQSIFEAGHEVDTAYLAGQMRRFDITVPRKANPFLPDILLKISRDIVRSRPKR